MNQLSNSEAMLKSLVNRISNLLDQKEAIEADIKEIILEAKSGGFDPKLLRKTIKIIRMSSEEKNKAAQEESELELYLKAVGAFADTPLGQAGLNKLQP